MRLGTIRYRQDSPIYRIAYTPDGKHFVTDGEDSILRVWNADDGRVVRRIDPEVGAMEDFALSSKGKLIMSSGITLEPGEGYVRHVTMTELETGLVVDQGSWVVENLGIDPSHFARIVSFSPSVRTTALFASSMPGQVRRLAGSSRANAR